MKPSSRREFIRNLGVSIAALPLVAGLPSLRAEAHKAPVKRLVLCFSPNGIVPPHFWPEEAGSEFSLKKILEPLSPYKERTLILKGISNKVRGDGDGHMRGMSCLLTGIELLPGNIQGGSDTPAGWAGGISIDQELKNFLQAQPATRTRFGSLELGVGVPNRADPWTRWTYAGADQPLSPISDPYRVFEKLYGTMKDRENLTSILDALTDDFGRITRKVASEDKEMLERHCAFVRQMETELKTAEEQKLQCPAPELQQGVGTDNDDIPRVFSMQSDLLANAFANDMARIATLQFTNSVGQARFRWLGIEEGHHSLSHDPDLNEPSQDKLVRINTWICEQIAALAGKLQSIPEPGGEGSLLDHTTILWTNELGKGNSHTLDNIPFVLVGGGLGFQMGRSLKFEKAAHNRLWLAIARAFGHELETFGSTKLSEGGALHLV